MTKAPKNVVASVLARLRNVAQEAGLSFNDILQSYVIERFLSRLSRSPHADTVLLKGALMLRVWDFYDIWILSRTLAFSGPALSQAIRSTFDRRQTSVPATLPTALTAKFFSEPVHVRQWAAFVRRIGEPALANEFSRVVADLTEFLMPAAKAAATSVEYPVSWEPLGPWQHGRSSKI